MTATLDLADITDSGERVIHLHANTCYFAHLSIYRFAVQFIANGRVLDAGSGTGYGSCYLADRGARSVHAIDISEKAVAFSQDHFRRRNLSFQVMDLERIVGFKRGKFDVIFSSNALEHIPDVKAFFRSAWRLMHPNGVMVAAVPPITSDALRSANLDNPYHLNIWSPRQWHHALALYFQEIQCFRHWIAKEGTTITLTESPEQTAVNEEDFVFHPISLDEYCTVPSYTAVFVVRKPRPAREIPSPGTPLSFIDSSFTRLPRFAGTSNGQETRPGGRGLRHVTALLKKLFRAA
jgi:2-polyprenyl-3-methyl-5-hydroxy-6-metoxy-1,4-benzoquinol methylase